MNQHQSKLQELAHALNLIIVGKEQQIKLLLCGVLARGHVLLEDLPGAGKTTLARALANLTKLDTSRVQFTADMLPADITGATIYQPQTQTFKLQKGPIFTNILLADEINRASPKCQSALLEAMEERQVSIDGQTLPMQTPFFVIATQNPSEQFGTYPLPESQLDRFLFRLSLGYMDAVSEKTVLLGDNRQQMLGDIDAVLSPDELKALQQDVDNVHVSDAIASYVQALLQTTRDSDEFVNGLSTRAGLAIIRAAKAWAFMHERSAVLPEHVQTVFPFVAYHRLTGKGVSAGEHELCVAHVIEHTKLAL